MKTRDTGSAAPRQGAALMVLAAAALQLLCGCGGSTASAGENAADTTAETVVAPAGFQHAPYTAPSAEALASLGSPLEIPLTLSASFGELRSNHFHNGVDFKTRGTTGLKVLSVADGYVSRVVVSPWGYGRAVYVSHPELGVVSVYGHLESFAPELAGRVAQAQEAAESFAVDLSFGPGEIPVTKGQLVGRSGNAGSSMGPHLHFAVTDLSGEIYHDPLDFYSGSIKDTTRPEVRSLTVYAAAGGVVDGGVSAVRRQPLPASPVFTAWGPVVPSIEAYDRMDGTSNIYGLKQLSLEVDGTEVWRYDVDYLEGANTRAINTLIHYPTMRADGRLTMTASQPEGAPLAPMVSGDGTLQIDREREYRCRYVMKDHYGNTTTQTFVIKGEKAAAAPVAAAAGTPVDWRCGGELQAEGCGVSIPPLALYATTPVTLAAETTSGYLSPLVTVGDPDVPLAAAYTLKIDLSDDSHGEKRQYCVVSVDSRGRKQSHGGRYEDGSMVVDVNRFGRFAVTTDTKAPVVTATAAPRRGSDVIRLRATDDLSGIDSYRATIDGEWVCMEYDGKNAAFSVVIDRSRFGAGSTHSFEAVFADACGNTSTYKATIPVR